MIQSEYYLPVLRAKPSEWKALADVPSNERARLLPLIELTPDIVTQPAPSKNVQTKKVRISKHQYALNQAAAFCDSVSSESARGRLIIDLGHFAQNNFVFEGVDLWKVIQDDWVQRRPRVTPVVGLHWSDESFEIVRKIAELLRCGAAIRLTISDVNSASLSKEVDRALLALGLDASDVDLIVDLKTSPFQITYAQLAHRLPQLSDWRTYSVCAGTFPPNLMSFSPEDSPRAHPRSEWQAWWSQVSPATQASLIESGIRPTRLPQFGDFTTQHGVYEAAPPIGGSYSVRYTTDDNIIVYRGYKPDGARGRDGKQFLGHARLLCREPHFMGWAFSRGDEYMFARSQMPAPASTGGSAQWRQASINHHLMATIAQIAAPDGSSMSACARAKARGPYQPAPLAPKRSARKARGAASSARPQTRPEN
jgi:Beta protein